MTHKLYLEELIELNPEINDLFKYTDYTDKMTNIYSDLYDAKLQKLNNKYLKRLTNKSQLTFVEKIIKHEILLELESNTYNFKYIPITYQNCIYEDLIDNINEDGLIIYKKKKDFVSITKRLDNLGEITDSIIDRFREGIKRKYTLPIILVKKMINGYKKYLSSPDSFDNKKNQYFAQSCKIKMIPHLKKIIKFLEKEYIDHARSTIGHCFLPNGKKEYEFIVKNSYGSVYSIKEIMELGRYHTSITKKLMDKIGPIKIQRPKSKQQLINYSKKMNTELIEELQHHFPKKYANIGSNMKIKVINRENSPDVYYNFIQETMYINYKVNPKMNELKTLLAHEGFPGHHLHLQYLFKHSNVPDILKLYNYDWYYEGYGLYVEDLVNHKNKENLYGKYNYQILRSVRLMIDTGIHYYGWSFDKALETMNKYIKNSITENKSELYRYIADPGQALGYYLGKLQIKNKINTNNNIKVFHKKYFELGPMPMDFFSNIDIYD